MTAKTTSAFVRARLARAAIETLEERRMLSLTIATTDPHTWQMTASDQITFENTLTTTTPIQKWTIQVNKALHTSFVLTGTGGDADMYLYQGKTLRASSATAGTSDETISRTLLPGVYHVVVSRAGGGDTPYTLFAATAAVASPTRIEAKPLGGNAVRVNWLDEAGDETGYIVQQWRKHKWHTVSSQPAGATAAVISNLPRNAAMTFSVSALGSEGRAVGTNTAMVATADEETEGLYKINSLDPMATGEASWTAQGDTLAIQSDFQDKWFEASSWQDAVYQAISGEATILRANGNTVEHDFPIGGDFQVDTVGDLHAAIPDNDLPGDDDQKVIALEDSYGEIDEDYDDFYWNVDVDYVGTVVNSTGDAGAQDSGQTPWTGDYNSEGDPEVTLHSAIDYANATGDLSSITFDIPDSDPGNSGGVWTISTDGEPTITTALDVNGFSQGGPDGSPAIVLDGGGTGLDFNADDSVSAEGLGFTSFDTGISDTSTDGSNDFQSNTFDGVTTGVSLDLLGDATGDVQSNQINATDTGISATADLSSGGQLSLSDNAINADTKDVSLDASGGGSIDVSNNDYNTDDNADAAALGGAVPLADGDSPGSGTGFNGNISFSDPAAQLILDGSTYGPLATGVVMNGNTAGTVTDENEDYSAITDNGGVYHLDLQDNSHLNVQNDKAGSGDDDGPKDGFTFNAQTGVGATVNVNKVQGITALNALTLQVSGTGSYQVTAATFSGQNSNGAIQLFTSNKLGGTLDDVKISDGTSDAIQLQSTFTAGVKIPMNFTNLNIFDMDGWGIKGSITAQNASEIDIDEQNNSFKNTTSGAVSFTLSSPDKSKFVDTSTLTYVQNSAAAYKYTLENSATVDVHVTTLQTQSILGDATDVFLEGSNTFDYDMKGSTMMDTAGIGVKLQIGKNLSVKAMIQDTLMDDTNTRGTDGFKVIGQLQIGGQNIVRQPNTVATLDEEDDSGITLENDTIVGTSGPGIVLDDELDDSISDTSLTNDGTGIEVDDGSPQIADNIIENNTGDGVLLADGSSASFSGNAIENNGGAGVDAQTTAAVSMDGNMLSGNAPDLLGGSAGQQLTGDASNDQINGGAGDDTLAGDGGSDTFIMGSSSGHDVISDFTAAGTGAADKLNLSQTAVAGGGFAGLTITQVGSNTLIDLGGGNNVTLVGVIGADLTAANFVFA